MTAKKPDKTPDGRKAPKAKPRVPSAPKPSKKAAGPPPGDAPAGLRLRQVAALPLRRGEAGIEVLLLTSRETHRWVIPKGWPMKGKTDWKAAATEALQEGGLTGAVHPEPLGAFSYFKRREEHFDLVDVAVYRLDVTRQKKTWREKGERDQRWCGLAEAADLVQEPGLQALLLDLAERL